MVYWGSHGDAANNRFRRDGTFQTLNSEQTIPDAGGPQNASGFVHLQNVVSRRRLWGARSANNDELNTVPRMFSLSPLATRNPNPRWDSVRPSTGREVAATTIGAYSTEESAAEISGFVSSNIAAA
jgi:hypothetical protein